MYISVMAAKISVINSAVTRVEYKINLFTRDVVIVESVPFSLRADGVELMDVLVSVMPLLRSMVTVGEEVTEAGEECVQVGKIQTNLNNECYKMAIIVQTITKHINILGNSSVSCSKRYYHVHRTTTEFNINIIKLRMADGNSFKQESIVIFHDALSLQK